MKHAFMIAGTHSGAGKTTAAMALLTTLHDRAMIVQPFKVGPDYLDPGYHNLFSGSRKSRNLDSFLLNEDYIRRSFQRNMRRADAAVVEGVMGLYDGRSAREETGSSAHIAKLLDLPVFLIIDAQAVARSAGAMILGFKMFDPQLKLKGVIFNRVSGEKHYGYLKQSIQPEWGVECLGYIPSDPEIMIPERHLGLTSALENPLEHTFFDRLKRAADHINIDRLLEMSSFTLPDQTEISSARVEERNKVRIGVAYDEAFSFYYEDNFDLLRDAGAQLVFFSPLYADRLPKDLDALYIGGGFPEMFAPKLSRNLSMIEQIQKFAAQKKLIYAECGGLIYLAEKFRDPEGQVYEMVGLVPGEVKMMSKLQSFGYKEISACSDTFLFSRGESLRSHEFHYSLWTPGRDDFAKVYEMGDRQEGFWSYPVLASYQHLHFGGHPGMARRFVETILEHRMSAEAVH